jgi:hypothetical protein
VQRVLVLEKDQAAADLLALALKQNGDLNLSLVPTMREACLIVAQQPQDLAFIPLVDAEQLLRSLRALQPNLKLVLTTADPNPALPDHYHNVFQGLLHLNNLAAELPALLKKSTESLSPVQNNEVSEPVTLPELPSSSHLNDACRQIGLTRTSSPIQMAVLSFDGRLIGYCGRGLETQACAVAELMGRTWEKEQFTAQLQYLQLPDYYDPRLIYSRAVAGVVLSLVAEPEVPISDMRQVADQLAGRLSESGGKPVESSKNHFTAFRGRNGSAAGSRSAPTHAASTYAIAWRPVKPLPVVLGNVVREWVTTLAAENGCRLRHLSVMPTIIHLVIGCPPGKSAAWAVLLMKTGINNEIQRQFGIQSSIWQKGFYAAESDQPLSEAELNMLLAP